MPFKNKNIIKNLLKISILSLIFISLSNFWWFFLTAKNIKTNNDLINKYNFKNTKIEEIAPVWVAIATNLAIKYTKNNSSNITIYNEIFKVDDFLNNSKETSKKIIIKNMIFIKEYLVFLKSDFNNILNKSNNRKNTLDNLINWLVLRQKNAIKNYNTLLSQKNILLKEYNLNNKKIEKLKKDLLIKYNETKTNETINLIEDYYKLKNKEIVLHTNIVFINNFLKEYDILNKYNSILLDTMVNNKDIIYKNSYLVIPSSWTNILKKLNLILDEKTFQKMKEENNKK